MGDRVGRGLHFHTHTLYRYYFPHAHGLPLVHDLQVTTSLQRHAFQSTQAGWQLLNCPPPVSQVIHGLTHGVRKISQIFYDIRERGLWLHGLTKNLGYKQHEGVIGPHPVLLRVCVSVCAQSRPVLCNPMDCKPTKFLYPWDFSGKNTEVGCHFLLRGIFLTQGLNPCLLHWQARSSPLSHQGSPTQSLGFR